MTILRSNESYQRNISLFNEAKSNIPNIVKNILVNFFQFIRFNRFLKRYLFLLLLLRQIKSVDINNNKNKNKYIIILSSFIIYHLVPFWGHQPAASSSLITSALASASQNLRASSSIFLTSRWEGPSTKHSVTRS